MAAPCVEHVAVRVRDFEAALAFFTDVMGMEITLTDPASGESPLNQAWVGGIQLQRDEAGSGDCSGDVSHIGLVADDVDALLEAVYAQRGVKQAEGKPRNWFVTAVWFNHRGQRAAVATAGGGVAVYGYAAGVNSAVGVGAIDGGTAVHGCCIALAQRFAAPVEGY